MGLLQYTTALQRAGGSGTPSIHYRIEGGSGQQVSFGTLRHYTRQWAVSILQYTATLQGAMGSGVRQYIAALHGAVGSVNLVVPAAHCPSVAV